MRDKVLGILRHALTFGGGYLAGKEIIEQAQVETLVGAIITLVGVLWSVKSKKKDEADTAD